MHVTSAWAQQTRPRFASIHVRFERRASPNAKEVSRTRG
jgi:hypothetical protein